MKRIQRILAVFLFSVLLSAVACSVSAPPRSGYIPPMAELRTVRLAVELVGNGTREWANETQEEINLLLEAEDSTLRLEIVLLETLTQGRFLDYYIQYESEKFDLFRTHFIPASNFPLMASNHELVEGGMVADITDHLTRYPELYAANLQDVWREASVNDRIYCFPLAHYNAATILSFAGRAQITVSNGWLEQLESDFPQTIEELSSLLLRAKDKNMPHKLLISYSAPPYALHRTYEEWPFYVDELSRFIFYPGGSVEPYIGSEIFLKDAAVIQKLNALGLLAYSNHENNRSVDPSIHAMAIYPTYHTGVVFETEFLAADKPSYRMQPAATSAIYVTSTCENVEDALEMLQYLYCHEEISLLFALGKEGRDWLRMEDGSVERLIIKDQQSMFEHGITRIYLNGSRREQAPSAPPVDLPAAGFVPSFDNNRAVMDLTKIYALRYGMIPLSEQESVANYLYEQGYYDLLEECRKQYEEYLK